MDQYVKFSLVVWRDVVCVYMWRMDVHLHMWMCFSFIFDYQKVKEINSYTFLMHLYDYCIHLIFL